MFLTYVALVHKADTDKADYGVIFPDFPGCVFGGHPVDDTLKNVSEGLIFHMEGLLEEGDALPDPTSFETILANPDYRAALALPFLFEPINS